MDGRINEISEPIEGCWISVVDPTATELVELSQKYQIDLDHLKAPLDEEERSRIEVEDNCADHRGEKREELLRDDSMRDHIDGTVPDYHLSDGYAGAL